MLKPVVIAPACPAVVVKRSEKAGQAFTMARMALVDAGERSAARALLFDAVPFFYCAVKVATPERPPPTALASAPISGHGRLGTRSASTV